jgi:hypothetical protein
VANLGVVAIGLAVGLVSWRSVQETSRRLQEAAQQGQAAVDAQVVSSLRARLPLLQWLCLQWATQAVVLAYFVRAIAREVGNPRGTGSRVRTTLEHAFFPSWNVVATGVRLFAVSLFGRRGLEVVCSRVVVAALLTAVALLLAPLVGRDWAAVVLLVIGFVLSTACSALLGVMLIEGYSRIDRYLDEYLAAEPE